MKFAFTDEQQMLQDTTNAFLSAKADSSSLRSVLASEAGFDESLWQTICTDMYWQGVAVPESAGGLGLGGVELAIIAESAGEALLASPLFAVSQSVLALRECAESDTAQSLYEAILEGEIVALAGTSAEPTGPTSVSSLNKKQGSGCYRVRAGLFPMGMRHPVYW